MMGGTNYFATLSETLGDEADSMMAAMDSLSGGVALAHQEAFLRVYNNIKDTMRNENIRQTDKSQLHVDIATQKSIAESTTDKLCNSAIDLINQQPDSIAQDQAANVFITGITLISDCVEIVAKQFETIDQKMNDFIRLEDGWNTVKASVIAANTGLKGVYYMLDTNEPYEAPRPTSVSSAGSSVFRRLSVAWQGPQSPVSSTRNSSTASAGAVQRNSVSGPPPVYRNPNIVRNSINLVCPTSLPSSANAAAFSANSFDNFDGDIFTKSLQSPKVATIPSPIRTDEQRDPFDTEYMEDTPLIPGLPVNNQPGSMSVAVS